MADISLPSVFQCYINFVLFSVFSVQCSVFVWLWLFEPFPRHEFGGKNFSNLALFPSHFSSLDWGERVGADIGTVLGWYWVVQ